METLTLVKPRKSRAQAYDHVVNDPHRYTRRMYLLTKTDPNDPEFLMILRSLYDLEQYGFDIEDPDIVDRAVEHGRCHYEQITKYRAGLAANAGRPPVPAVGDVVYYVRIGNRCKIGYTSNMRGRMATINPEEILATEPGTVDLEQMRHREFAALHSHGEWFRLEEPLTSHIDRLRATG